MEKYEFDLRDYSLSVIGSRVVIERFYCLPSYGDILSDSRGAVVIYSRTESDGSLVSLAGTYHSPKMFSVREGVGFGYTRDYHPAAPEQVQMLMHELAQVGYEWDATLKNLCRKNDLRKAALLASELNDILNK